MFQKPFLFALVFAAWVIAGPAQAHCDGIDGPVAQGAQRALDTGNVNLALPYAPAAAEAEILARFNEARRVRRQGRVARALADRSFMETVVRLHRLGEGASYTGLQPAGVDYGPIIPAAEHALETNDLSAVNALLRGEIDHGLAERLAHINALRNASAEPTTHADVQAARERIEAELGFVIYAETLRQAIAQAGEGHHTE